MRYGVVITHTDLIQVDCSLLQQPFARQQRHKLQLLASASHHSTGVGQRPMEGKEGGREGGWEEGGKGGREVNDHLLGGNGEEMCTYLDVCLGVNLVDGITRGASGLIVKVVALDKHTVLTHTAYPYLSLVLLIQDHTCCMEEGERMTKDAPYVCSHPIPFPMCSLALSLASVRCTLESLPRQNRSPPDGST